MSPTYVPQQPFADNSQLYNSVSPSNYTSQIYSPEDRLTALYVWRSQKSLHPNPEKSDTVLCGTWKCSHFFSDVTIVEILGSVVPLADHMKLLSVTCDNCLSMDEHVYEVSCMCFHHSRALRHIRPAVTANHVCSLLLAHDSTMLTLCCIASHQSPLTLKCHQFSYLNISCPLSAVLLSSLSRYLLS